MTVLPITIYRFSAIPIKDMTFFTKLEQKTFTIHMETQKTPNSQSILRKKNGAGGINLPDLRLYYKASHQDSMALAQKQKYRPVKEDRNPRNKPMHLWVTYFLQRRQEHTMGQRQPLQ